MAQFTAWVLRQDVENSVNVQHTFKKSQTYHKVVNMLKKRKKMRLVVEVNLEATRTIPKLNKINFDYVSCQINRTC